MTTNAKKIFYILTAFTLILGFYKATQQFWVSDDAFVSYRYALNLVEGRGLVFNPGERVEGFTNFLWVMLQIPGLQAGLDPIITSNILSLFFYAMLILCIARYGRNITGIDGTATATEANRELPAIPLSLGALALHKHMQIFATSGLETMLFTGLITVGVLLILKGQKETRGPAQQIGLALLVLAAMTRPDGLLIYGIAALSVLNYEIRQNYQEKTRPTAPGARLQALILNTLKANSFLMLVFIPYWLWRWNYYGLFFPNTYYAKSGNLSNYAQGWIYLQLYFKSYWIFLLIPALIVPATLLSKKREPGTVLLPVIIAAWLNYIMKVGGDFMFARFIIPITPLLILYLERLVLTLLYKSEIQPLRKIQKLPGLAILIFITLTAGVILRHDPYRSEIYPVLNGIAEEQKVYPLKSLRKVTAQVAPYRKIFLESGAVVGIGGAQLFLAYAWNPVETIETVAGLTDKYIASRPIKQRGRPGHEKTAPLSYLRKRRVNLLLAAPPPERDRGYNRIKIKGLIGPCEIIAYVPKVMNALRKERGITFQDFPEYLRDYLASRPSASRVRKDLPFFKSYYFDYAADDVTLKRLESIAREE